MKEVKITITGQLVIVDYCAQSVIDANIESGEYDEECDAFAGNGKH